MREDPLLNCLCLASIWADKEPVLSRERLWDRQTDTEDDKQNLKVVRSENVLYTNTTHSCTKLYSEWPWLGSSEKGLQKTDCTVHTSSISALASDTIKQLSALNIYFQYFINIL